MAKSAVLNCWVRINGVDLSANVSALDVKQEANDVDVTGMGQFATDHIQGLKDEGFDMTFLGDFAPGRVDATLAPLYTGGTPFLVEVAYDGTAISATNPKYSGSCILLGYHPISGGVGDANTTDVSFVCKGTITRGTV